MLGCFRPQLREEVGFGYRTAKQLGQGANGSVYLAKDVAGNLVAVKACLAGAAAWQLQMAARECSTIAQATQHVSLVRPYSVRLTPDSLQLILQHCSGGTLEAYCKQHTVSEDLACYFFHQLVAVLEHLHSSKIAYRDMKLQNVLLSNKPSRKCPPRLVVCDLGTAKSWTGQSATCQTFVGTPGFMSPQVLTSMFNKISMSPSAAADADSSHHSNTSRSSHTYDARKADIWALGALLHYMLHRQLPYGYDSFAPLLPPHEALLTLLQLENEHTWKDAAGSHGLKPISPEAQDLLDQLLHPEEAERISIRCIKQHPWYKRALPQQYEQALRQMQAEQEEINAAAKAEIHQECKQLAAQAVDKLCELTKCPAVLQELRQEGRCLTVPLDGVQSSSVTEAAWQQQAQQLEEVLLELQAVADAAALAQGSSEGRSRLSLSSFSAASEPSVLVQQQQREQKLRAALAAQSSSRCGNAAADKVAEAAPPKLVRDDTCYLMQVASS